MSLTGHQNVIHPTVQHQTNGSIGGPGWDAWPGCFDVLKSLVTRSARFRVTLSLQDRDSQLERRHKLRQALDLPRFNPRTEEELEDWVDEAALQVTRVQLSCALFQEAWQQVSEGALGGAVASIPNADNYERLVDMVALDLFPYKSVLPHRLEAQILNPLRHENVRNAKTWVEKITTRYARLCCRRDYTPTLTNDKIYAIAVASMPLSVSRDVQMKIETEITWSELWKCAQKIESMFIHSLGELPQPMSAFPADEDDADMQQPRKRVVRSQEKRPAAADLKCHACGELGHFRKDCDFNKHRCANCGRIGHIKKACRSLVIHDDSGRVETALNPRPSGPQLTQRRDNTQQDKLVSVEKVMGALRDMTQKRATKSAASRLKKKVETGWTRKRKQIDHPIGAAQEQESDEDEEDEYREQLRAELMEEFVDKVHDLFLCEEQEEYLYQAVPTTVTVDAIVNGSPRKVVIDTGASRSLCSEKEASELELQPTTERKKFRGLGISWAVKAEPVPVKFNGKTIDIAFWVVEDSPHLPVLIGVPDLKEHNVCIDVAGNRLFDRETSAMIAAAEEEKSEEVMDTMTQRPKTLTDLELAAEGLALLDQKCQHLAIDERAGICEVFTEYMDVWLKPRAGAVKGHHAEFEVSGDPVCLKLRRLTAELQKELENQLEHLLAADVIRPSKSPWASVPVFVKKHDGGYRMCLDYRQVNKRMKPDRYPLPLLWEQLQEAAHHAYYIMLDLNWGFWNLPLAEYCKEYTAFITHKGLFEFNVLPFGIRNSPAEFQRLMDRVLSPSVFRGILVYVDDIIIYADSFAELLNRLEWVLDRLQKRGLYLKLSKTEICPQTVKFLGHVIGPQGIYPDGDKVKALQEVSSPDSVRQLRRFLGAASFLRKFVPHFSHLSAPLTLLLKKNVPFDWGPEQENAFQELKDAISDQVLLTAPKGSGPFAIASDASNRGIGAVLMQWQEEELMVLEFASKTLTPTELRWNTYELEAYAVRWAVGKFADYIKTGFTIIVTDNKALSYLEKATSPKVIRWALYLQSFDLVVRHIDAAQNEFADFLSRATPDTGDVYDDDKAIAIPVFAGIEEEPSSSSQRKPDVAQYPYVPSTDDFLYGYKNIPLTDLEERDTFVATDALRYHCRTNKLFVPVNCRELLLFWFHGSRYGVHCGINRTLKRMKKWVWWPNIGKDVAKYVNDCLPCKRHALPPRKSTALNVLTKPHPFELISVDLVGPRKRERDRPHTYYYLVIIDHATRFLVTVPSLGCPTARWIVETIGTRWVQYFQAPTVVLSDRGPQLRAPQYREYILEVLRAYALYTSPYYPQGNAVNEAVHNAIEMGLSTTAYQSEMPSFEEALSDVTAVYNSTPHPATGQTPNYAMFGAELTMPGWQERRPNTEEAVDRGRRRLAEKQEWSVRCRYASDPQLKLKAMEVQPGDWVVYWLSDYERGRELRGRDTSYNAKWSLPARVLKVRDKQCTVICWGGDKSQRDVPIAHVRILEGGVPATLIEANYKALEVENPYPVSHWLARRSRPVRPLTWDDFLAPSTPETKEETEVPEVPVTKKVRPERDVVVEITPSDTQEEVEE